MDDLAEKIHGFASATRFSGVVRVDQNGEERFSRAYGLAHRGFAIQNQVDTQFAIASGGKGFTALAVVSLIVDGDLALDTPVRSFLGADLPLIDSDVTVEHLLAHRSGIGDYLDEENEDLDLTDYVLQSPVHELAATEGFLSEVDGYPSKFPADERFSYSNSGYVVLALIGERASGVAYHDLVSERVLKPAGMSDTAFLRSDEPSGRMAVGYLLPDGLRTNVFHLPVRGSGDGGIYTTIEDIHAFWNALFAGLIVPEGWVAEITRQRSTLSGDTSYGLGFWLASKSPRVRLIGSDAGVSFYSEHDPTTHSTRTVLANTTEGAWPIVQHLRDVLDA